MSECVNWAIKPWEWQRAPEWWIERMMVYFGAKTEVTPVLEAKRRRRLEQYGSGY